MSAAPTVQPLHGNQIMAVEPADTVWLSASAGTGKTHVLSSRVLRLLLQPGVEPSQILCLTFTKAGATEMADRINSKLARWVRLDAAGLAAELKAIGADFGPSAQERARTLFASVLDSPGGGLRIDTIHAFSQWLLGAFPFEAQLNPGTRPMEDRERTLLLRQVLSDLLVAAESDPLGDPQLLAAVADLSLRLGPDQVEAYLLRCASAREAWFGPGGWQEPMRENVLRLLNLKSGAGEHDVIALCADDRFDVESLRCCLSAYSQWDGVKGRGGRIVIADWLAAAPAQRLEMMADLHKVLFTQKDTIKDAKSLVKFEEFFEEAAQSVLDCALEVRTLRILLDLAAQLVPALRLGRAFALAWEQAKAREGLIDFDDQIRKAANLLGDSDLAGWIRYKLDRRFDHILVDEAQDTNAAQWRIIDALTDEYFAGQGQRGDLHRTLFVVGDYKQAIFGFQGTSPENFAAARVKVKARMLGAADNADAAQTSQSVKPLMEYGLDRSFRTAQNVLEFVDTAIARIGHERFGLEVAPEAHEGMARPGYVAIWRPVIDGAATVDDADGEEVTPDWLSRPERRHAENIAQQVKTWLDQGFVLVKGDQPRRAGPGDVMVLVRKRGALAGLIVARLHAAGVPVAGVDRLRLGAPLAVRDLAAALRFAAQPFDSLNLACLLVSPLIGWTQEQLLEHGHRDKGVALWEHLRRSRHGDVASAMLLLGDLLRRADFDPPQALLHWLLVGPWQGRRKLVARLGHEANDPIDELINAAGAYASTATPSLTGFLNWFDAGEGELKREPDSAAGLVRVMTVHGSKGLQSPIVILADATTDPTKSRMRGLDMPDPSNPERRIPIPYVNKAERRGPLAAEHDRVRQAEDEEHWRLLYVAMTRAEEALFIGGALGKGKAEPVSESWHAQLAGMFSTADWVADPIWGGRLEWGRPPALDPGKPPAAELELDVPLPGILRTVPAQEPRPPRPLAPSALGEDSAADPPFPASSGAAAARRGVLMHRLLERLPALAPDRRDGPGREWLARNGADFSDAERAAMLASALAVLNEPGWADIFGQETLAEVPVAALVGERVVAGTIDRLLLGADHIRIVDFKTARRPPAGIEQVPPAILRQMAAYAAALEAVYPGRCVEAALLYTATPQLIEIPAALLDQHKRALLAPQ